MATAAPSLASGAVSSPGLFSLINQFQMYMLLLTLNAFIHQDVVDYLNGMKIVTFSFDFIDLSNVPILNKISDYLDINQNPEYLSSIGLEYQSAILNNLKLFFVILLIIAWHLWYWLLYLLLKRWKGWIERISTKILRLLTFTLYIRIIIESYFLLFISSFSEIFNYNLRNNVEIVSFSMDWMLFTMLTFILIISFLMWRKAFNNNEINESRFYEFVSGTKDTKIGRMYTFIFLTRRFISIVWIISTRSLNKYINIIGFSLIQLIFSWLFNNETTWNFEREYYWNNKRHCIFNFIIFANIF